MDGFVKDTVTLWENQYPCMRKDGIDTPLRLLYLVDENGQNGALYMLDLDDPEEIYPFVCMNYNQYKHTIGEETTSAEASTQEGETGLFQSTESQMRLILCAFVVVVLILLIIIVVLIVKRKKDDDDPYDDFMTMMTMRITITMIRTMKNCMKRMIRMTPGYPSVTERKHSAKKADLCINC